MKKIFLAVAVIIFSAQVFSQNQTVPTKVLQKVMELKMPLTAEDEMPGKRGAGVVWHPVQKKYYAAMAGNVGFPLAVFDAKGNRLSADSSVCMRDVRGIWYNPVTKEIQGNEYSDYGWFSYVLDAKGMVKDYKVLLEGMNQPDAQSVGAYNYTDKKVLFVFDGKLHSYDIEDGTPSSTTDINWGTSGDLVESGADDYNYTSLIYTGIKDAEIGFLNVVSKQIELYDYASCNLSRVLTLPDFAPVQESFNFAYCNGIYWLFDMDARIWFGYK